MTRLSAALSAFVLSALCLLPLPVMARSAPLNMGFYLPGIRDANLTDVRVSLQLWAEQIGNPYQLQAKAIMYDDMDALYRDAMAGRVDMVIAPGMEMAETFKPEEIGQGFAGRRQGGEEGLVLIVAESSGVHQFSELRGKRLSRLANDRLSDIYLEIQCQRQTGSPCAQFFTLTEEKRDVHAIHKVFFGQADAALVRLSTLRAAIELNPQVARRVRMLLHWKTTSLSFGMMTMKTDQTYRDLVLRAALQATSTTRGKQILELFKTDYMELVDRADVQPYWRLHREYQELNLTPPRRKP